ncbi:MAG: DNA (cytosine-5-)-methyltransferase [Muribaculaceae bacterium]|nr:DNA (cytosine-5-)-methyltransferase [Muribaculaceae bacterium]
MNKPSDIISANNFAALLGVSRATVDSWIRNGKFKVLTDSNGHPCFDLNDAEIAAVPEIRSMIETHWASELLTTPDRQYTSIELFAGAGGLALGMENAGFTHLLLNEFDHAACETLRSNRPDWNVVEGDIHDIDFIPYRDKVDFLSGGFPCQAFSYAGKRLGFEETRGTLFFELARAVKEIRPKVFLGENVRGLLEHDNGRTLQTIRNVIEELGYTLIPPRVLRALQYNVPQKRERLILIAIRNDIAPYVHYDWPDVSPRIRTLRDAFFKGDLYVTDVPKSQGQTYPDSKKKVMELVPEGGDWRNLPEDIARRYMKGSFNLGGGKTGMARRLSMDEPSLTLTCAPAQKQTERCHPTETRPLTIREYARIQTFPDEWIFKGTIAAQYKQIGNAVPVNMAWAIGRSLIRIFNDINRLGIATFHNSTALTRHYTKLHGLFEGMACEPSHTYTDSGNPEQPEQ